MGSHSTMLGEKSIDFECKDDGEKTWEHCTLDHGVSVLQRVETEPSRLEVLSDLFCLVSEVSYYCVIHRTLISFFYEMPPSGLSYRYARAVVTEPSAAAVMRLVWRRMSASTDPFGSGDSLMNCLYQSWFHGTCHLQRLSCFTHSGSSSWSCTGV
ncbi:hypothetical protein RSAG8_13857, partial [Rhizoctonia solani AG-8 WAC10335]